MASCYFPEEIDAFSRAEITPPVGVDGFRSVVDGIDAAIKAQIAGPEPRPLFVLITGESGTGRSAAAKYVLDQFVRVSGIAAEKLLLPKVKPSYDPRKDLGEWLEKMAVSIARYSRDLAKETLRTIREASADTYRGDFALLIPQFVDELQKKASFGILLENVLDPRTIDAVQMVFEAAPSPCVFTAIQMPEVVGRDEPMNDITRKIKAAFNNNVRKEHRMLVELSSLDGEDVAHFAQQHWIASKVKGDPPFEHEGIQAVFSNKPRKIGMARTLLGRLHSIKLETDEAGPPWGKDILTGIMPNILLDDDK